MKLHYFSTKIINTVCKDASVKLNHLIVKFLQISPMRNIYQFYMWGVIASLNLISLNWYFIFIANSNSKFVKSSTVAWDNMHSHFLFSHNYITHLRPYTNFHVGPLLLIWLDFRTVYKTACVHFQWAHTWRGIDDHHRAPATTC